MSPVTIVIAVNHINNSGSLSLKLIFLSVTRLNCGRNSQTITHATTSASSDVTRDSLMYWKIREPRWAPIDFFMPISFALRDALAVDKFMKLIQAIIKINTAMTENSRTY